MRFTLTLEARDDRLELGLRDGDLVLRLLRLDLTVPWLEVDEIVVVDVPAGSEPRVVAATESKRRRQRAAAMASLRRF